MVLICELERGCDGGGFVFVSVLEDDDWILSSLLHKGSSSVGVQ